MFSKCHCHCQCRFWSGHNSDQMFRRSNVSRIALLGCSLNVVVIVIVFVVVIVFVIVFFLVRSSLWSNVSRVSSLQGRSLRVFSKCLCYCVCLCHCLFVCQVMSSHHSDQMSEGKCQDCPPQNCPLGGNPGSVFNNGHSFTCTYSVTRSPIELSGDS